MATSPPFSRNKAPGPAKPVAKKRGKVMTFLRTFLSSRPSRARLLQTGILKERTFGSDLSEHLVTTGREVPLVLEKCTEFIEERGIVDGIYRLSGMTSNIQKLRLLFDGDSPPNLAHETFVRDIHCISSLLKLYFRELPNPLLTHQLYERFVAAMQIENEVQRQMAVHHVVQQLPASHFRTLEYLLRHLSRIAAHGDSTGMNSKNLAIVWAPNLLRPLLALETRGYALLEVNIQAVTIEYLIKNVHLLFQQGPIGALVSSPPHSNNMLIPRQPRLRPSFKVDDSMKSRLAAISVSPSPKLISLQEARARRAMSASSRPRSKSVDAGGGRSYRNRDQDSTRYCTSIELPVQRFTGNEGSNGSANSFGGRRWRSFFARGRNFERGYSVAKIQETDQGTFVSVARETRPPEHEGMCCAPVEVIQARGVEEAAYNVPCDDKELPVTQHVCLEQVQELRPQFDVHQPVTVCLSQPVTLKSTARVKKQPVLTSFNQVTSQQTMFYTTVEYHLLHNSTSKSFDTRASSVGDRAHLNESPSEIRPLSVYDNWPRAVYESRRTQCRHSTPVFRSDYNVKPEVKVHRYSSPVDVRSTSSVLQRSKSQEQRFSDEKIAIASTRLAQVAFIPNVSSH